jgi:hypothetical protein
MVSPQGQAVADLTVYEINPQCISSPAPVKGVQKYRAQQIN